MGILLKDDHHSEINTAVLPDAMTWNEEAGCEPPGLMQQCWAAVLQIDHVDSFTKLTPIGNGRLCMPASNNI